MNKKMLVTAMSLFGGIALTCFACADEAADAGTKAAECVLNDLIAQCPPNTIGASLTAESAAECANRASGSGDAVSLSVSGENLCVGDGDCAILCEPVSCGTCPSGSETPIASISPTDGVVCGRCAACGNGECEAGEDATACPQDCATECTPNSSRCETGLLRRCNPRGEWEEPLPCAEGERCVEDRDEETGNSSATCVGPDSDEM